MAILKVSRLGHPVLRQVAEPVPEGEIGTPLFQHFLESMVETMREYDGVGLAAPQVHTSRQVFVMEVEDNPRYPDMPLLPLVVAINPKITLLSEEVAPGWEGCLSIPDLRGRVARVGRVRLEALNRQGESFIQELEGFHARIVQHEYDHLMGRVYLDRMADLSTLTFLKEFSRYWSPAEVEVEEEE